MYGKAALVGVTTVASFMTGVWGATTKDMQFAGEPKNGKAPKIGCAPSKRTSHKKVPFMKRLEEFEKIQKMRAEKEALADDAGGKYKEKTRAKQLEMLKTKKFATGKAKRDKLDTEIKAEDGKGGTNEEKAARKAKIAADKKKVFSDRLKTKLDEYKKDPKAHAKQRATKIAADKKKYMDNGGKAKEDACNAAPKEEKCAKCKDAATQRKCANAKRVKDKQANKKPAPQKSTQKAAKKRSLAVAEAFRAAVPRSLAAGDCDSTADKTKTEVCVPAKLLSADDANAAAATDCCVAAAKCTDTVAACPKDVKDAGIKCKPMDACSSTPYCKAGATKAACCKASSQSDSEKRQICFKLNTCMDSTTDEVTMEGKGDAAAAAIEAANPGARVVKLKLTQMSKKCDATDNTVSKETFDNPAASVKLEGLVCMECTDKADCLEKKTGFEFSAGVQTSSRRRRRLSTDTTLNEDIQHAMNEYEALAGDAIQEYTGVEASDPVEYEECDTDADTGECVTTGGATVSSSAHATASLSAMLVATVFGAALF